MSYRKFTCPRLEPIEGYTKLASTYSDHHAYITSFDKGIWTRLLPRNVRECHILDLGSGNGRIMPIFRERGCASYTAIDISQAMLDRFRASDVIKICTDLNTRFIETITPNHYDAICCFFVLEYITDLEAFFGQCYDALAQDGVMIASYFFSRREVVFGHAEDTFKIHSQTHTYDEIENAMTFAFFTVQKMDIIDAKKVVGYIYRLTKTLT